MGKNVKKILSVYEPRKPKENIKKKIKGTEDLLPSISTDVKKMVSIPGTKNG